MTYRMSSERNKIIYESMNYINGSPMGGYSGGKQEIKQYQSDSIPSIFLTFEEMSKSWKKKKNKKEAEIE